VKTIVRSSPNRSPSRAATRNDTACSSPEAKNTTPITATEAPNRAENQ
jgi:hypothetical protein